jgi:1-acyl-sn-glycerol-3-phosphate acyltransferase
MQRVYYYNSFSDDLVESKNQKAKVPSKYPYNKPGNILERAAFSSLLACGRVYLKVNLKLSVKNRSKLPKDSAFFLYSNHTQPLGDVFLSLNLLRKQSPRVIVSPANLGIPIIGKHLHLAALPIPDTLSGLRRFQGALNDAYAAKCPIIVYPEAHVWPYYTKIRPLPTSAFRPAAKLHSPVYAMTLTYKKPRFGKKPKTIAYIDGPFLPDSEKTVSENASLLQEQVKLAMDKRAKTSNCEYIKFLSAKSNQD